MRTDGDRRPVRLRPAGGLPASGTLLLKSQKNEGTVMSLQSAIKTQNKLWFPSWKITITCYYTTLQAILMAMLQEMPELELLGLQFYPLG